VSTQVSPQQVCLGKHVGEHCPVVMLQTSHAPHCLGTHVYELRAVTSPCRIEPARERLAHLVERFAPGDDCADLRAARALL
jgi:hypothetical protein